MSNRVLLLCLAAGALLPAADTVVIEQIIAKVNGEIITRSEIDRMKKGMIARRTSSARRSTPCSSPKRAAISTSTSTPT